MLQPPYFMNKELMAGIAQLEDFDEQLYKVFSSSSSKFAYLPAVIKKKKLISCGEDGIARGDSPPDSIRAAGGVT